MTEAEKRALAKIEATTDVDDLMQLARNATGVSAAVSTAALRRLAQVSSKHNAGTVEHDCWTMVHVVEGVRKLKGRKVSRMNRLRPKIETDGEIAALAYCASKRTEGFDEVMAYGMPELSAEAIVLRHPAHFSEKTLDGARKRLSGAGYLVGEDGNVIQVGG